MEKELFLKPILTIVEISNEDIVLEVSPNNFGKIYAGDEDLVAGGFIW